MLPRDHSCDTLVKNEASFCPRPKSLPEAKVKISELIPLPEKSPKTSQYFLCYVVISGHLMQIYNEQEQKKKCKIRGEEELQKVEWS